VKLALVLVVSLGACAPVAYEAPPPPWVADTSSFGPPSAQASTLADRYREVAQKIVAAGRASRGAYDKLSQLTDTIGHRLSGEPSLDKAIAWAAQTMKDEGLEVHTEKVMVPHWQRGAEDAEITAPVARPLHVIGLGGTVGTPKGGVAGPVVVVHDWKELEARKAQVKGAIVVYNVPMPAYSEDEGSGYGKTVEYRMEGASQAAKRGAICALVRSVTAHSLRSPHTGAMHYDPAQPKIPTAAISVEDAELIDRLAAKGPVNVYVRLDTQQLPDAESANVIGELRGREKPDEVVVIGAHIDSWDVGQGAQDDGAGVVTMMQALATLGQLGLTPRRTIRVVLYTNEENGVRGGKTYAEQHAAELPNTVLAVESDSGGFPPVGFTVGHKDPEAAARARARIADIASLLHEVGATTVKAGGGGTDISPMQAGGVPQVGLSVDGKTYFDYHHSEADTLDKVQPQDLADMVAAAAVLAYVVADMPDRVDAP
jgi:Zn-dependent M28 family amino/carboxypeptidase